MKSLSHVWFFATPWTVTYQGPLSLGFCRQECWNGLPFPSPGYLPNPRIKPESPALWADALPSEPPGKPKLLQIIIKSTFTKHLLNANHCFRYLTCFNSFKRQCYDTVSVIYCVMPDVRIPKREERRLPRQCNWKKKGSLLLTWVRAPAARPMQWYRVREPSAQAVTQFIRCA